MIASSEDIEVKKTSLYWVPRGVAILSAILMIILSLDSFGGDTPILEQILGFVIHLIPSFIIIIALALSWKNELLGGIIFNAIALFSFLFFRTYEDFVVFLIVTFPLLLIGELFFYHWYRSSMDAVTDY